jgi:enolase
MQIEEIKAREILDSRGQPTVEVDVILYSGEMGRASVPSGASTGQFEALEWRDKDTSRFAGKGVKGAIKNVLEIIRPALGGISIENQRQVDQILLELDGTEDKSKLGANAILAVSLAVARARAQFLEQPLFVSLHKQNAMTMPVPMLNIMNGGAHANNTLDIQEFMIMPLGASSFIESLEMSHAVITQLRHRLQKQGLTTSVGDEGGFAPNLSSHELAFELIMQSIASAGLKAGKDMYLALDVASSEWYQNGMYHLPKSKIEYTAQDLISYYEKLCEYYPIVSIEDGLAETDWDGWKLLSQRLGQRIQLVGDDLFVTNMNRLNLGIQQQVANAILIKLNQIGTLTETLETMALAAANGYRSVVSHRSGETEDTFIADLAVGTGCGQIKTGSLCRTDRICKYNELLRISEMKNIPFAGKNLFPFL